VPVIYVNSGILPETEKVYEQKFMKYADLDFVNFLSEEDELKKITKSRQMCNFSDFSFQVADFIEIS
jgi:hypothetical protein